jgi:hypothetical protein
MIQTDIIYILIEDNYIYLKDSERRSTMLLINKKVPLVHAGNEIELTNCTNYKFSIILVYSIVHIILNYS